MAPGGALARARSSCVGMMWRPSGSPAGQACVSSRAIPASSQDWDGGRCGRLGPTQHRRHGAPLVVPLGKHSDRPTEDVIATVLHYAAGRVYLAPGPWR